MPPFRGRAIRMLKRDVPFEQLEIDTEALEKRKAAEYDKLNRVVRFALSGGCRQQEILRYFGERDAAACQHCDNCAKRSGKSGRRERGAGVPPADAEQAGRPHHDASAAGAADEGVIQAVRIVLSGVARAEKRVACGKNLIAQMLCGSNSAKVTKLGLNRLTTFGLLRQLKQPEVVTLIDLLMANGCLDQEEINRFRPVLRLTPLGGDVMRGTTDVPGLNLPHDLRMKLRRPVAKEPPPPKTEERRPGDAPAMAPELRGRADMTHDDAWNVGLGPPECDESEPNNGVLNSETDLRAAAELSSAGWISESVPLPSDGPEDQSYNGDRQVNSPPHDAQPAPPTVVLLDVAVARARLLGRRVPGHSRCHARGLFRSCLAGGRKRSVDQTRLMPRAGNCCGAGCPGCQRAAPANPPHPGPASWDHL